MLTVVRTVVLVVRMSWRSRLAPGTLVLGIAACGWFESEQAQQVADATHETVARGVDKAKTTIEQVDLEQWRKAWYDAVEAMRDRFEVHEPPPPGVDPLADAAEAISCDERYQHCTVTAEFADRARGHTLHVASQIKVSAVKGEVSGIRLDQLEPGSLATRVGFRAGDVIIEVNEIPLSAASEMMTLYLAVRQAKRFEVVYRRGTEDRTLVIEVV